MAEREAEALLAEIRRQAALERERILADSRGRAERAREAADVEIRDMEAEAERHLKHRLELDRARVLGELRLEERSRLLRSRRRSIESCFERAAARIAEVEPARYRAALRELVREALESVGEGAELRVSGADVPAVRQILAALGSDAKVSEAELESGSVTALSRDGLRRARNGVRERLDASRTLLEEDVARILFGGS